jgi:SNF2-related domain
MDANERSQGVTGNRLLYESTGYTENNSADSDVHRAITGGQTVWLCPATDSTKGIRINQYTGNEVKDCEISALSRKAARGGLLCDDPGLGKTITVLSLVLQTAGLMAHVPEMSDEECAQEEIRVDEEVFKAYWQEHTVPHTRRAPLLKLVNNLLKTIKGKGFNAADIKTKMDKDEYKDFSKFLQDIR